jgi:[ribosomal protein S5]-alanine N-acetyltransferase
MTVREHIRLQTAHYILRTLEPADVSQGWTQWLADSGTARMLNAQARAASIDEIRQYVASFDGHNNHLLGIFEKDGGALIGIRAIYIDWPSKEFVVNVLVGETQSRGKGARAETADALYDHFFATLGMTAARCTVLAHNAAVLKVMDARGWQLTGTSSKPAIDGGAPLELRNYRLARETWAARRRD